MCDSTLLESEHRDSSTRRLTIVGREEETHLYPGEVMKMFRNILICAALVAGSATANAAVILDEGFDDVGTLAGAGWLTVNNSAGGTADPWFQGNTGVFDAAAGAADSYIA